MNGAGDRPDAEGGEGEPESGDDASETGPPDVVLVPGGPMLLRGDHVVVDEDGVEHRTRRPVSAVCRCGASAIKPWCDGTHKVVRRRADP